MHPKTFTFELDVDYDNDNDRKSFTCLMNAELKAKITNELNKKNVELLDTHGNVKWNHGEV